jgi:hypothetical protein
MAEGTVQVHLLSVFLYLHCHMRRRIHGGGDSADPPPLCLPLSALSYEEEDTWRRGQCRSTSSLSSSICTVPSAMYPPPHMTCMYPPPLSHPLSEIETHMRACIECLKSSKTRQKNMSACIKVLYSKLPTSLYGLGSKLPTLV